MNFVNDRESQYCISMLNDEYSLIIFIPFDGAHVCRAKSRAEQKGSIPGTPGTPKQYKYNLLKLALISHLTNTYVFLLHFYSLL